ncbi:hypothetical protein DQ384_21830 [Sphaerisporangium album]|uniref:Uncharacterized protein n=1 Tax=Sphaerisporangium album TaxID=509200 RepID=A0A367FF37_9ACTN|nr:hypothetical protein DQ384_21830 [Sphaerisporangium album]
MRLPVETVGILVGIVWAVAVCQPRQSKAARGEEGGDRQGCDVAAGGAGTRPTYSTDSVWPTRVQFAISIAVGLVSGNAAAGIGAGLAAAAVIQMIIT